MEVNNAQKIPGSARKGSADTGEIETRKGCFMRCWFGRLMLLLLILLLVVGGVIQALLWTDYPKRWVLDTLGAELAMKLTADSFATGWGGKTEIKNLIMTGPGEQEPLLAVAEIRVRHSTLPRILWTRSIRFDAVQIRQPVLHVRQDAGGIWNVEDLIERFGAGESSSSAVVWPEAEITDGRLVISDSGGRIIRFEPVRFRGTPSPTAQVRFELDLSPRLQFRGRFTPGGNLVHQIDLKLDGAEEFLAGWLSREIQPVHLAGRWNGSVHQGKLAGKLRLDTLEYDQTRVQGNLSWIAGADQIQVDFEKVRFRRPEDSPNEWKITSGKVRFDFHKWQADHLILEAMDQVLIVDGTWDGPAEKGFFQGTWTGSLEERGIRHQTLWQAALELPGAGQRQVDLLLTTRGQTPRGQWETRAEIQGSETAGSGSQWRTVFPSLVWQQEGRQIQLDTITADWQVEWPHIRLQDFATANAPESAARGKFSFADFSWSLNLAAKKFQLQDHLPAPLDVQVDATGEPGHIRVSRLEAACQGLALAGEGRVELPDGYLQNGHLSIQGTFSENPSPPLQGSWHLAADLQGRLYPVDLRLHGQALLDSLKLRKKTLPPISIPCSGTLHPDELEFAAGTFSFLDGDWQINGTIPFADFSPQAQFSIEDLPLARLGEWLEMPSPLEGLAAAEGTVRIPLRDPGLLTVSGRWRADHLKIPPVAAETAEGLIRLEEGRLNIEDIHLRQDAGTARGEIRLTLAKPLQMQGTVQTHDWPIPWQERDITLYADGRASLQVDWDQRNAEGSGDLSLAILHQTEPVGHLRLHAEADKQNLTLSDIRIGTLGGEIEGRTVIPLADRLAAQADFRWQNLNLNRLADYGLSLDSLTGQSSGSLQIRPADEPRPLEPLRFEAVAEVSEGSLLGIPMRKAEATGYIGPNRYLITQSRLEVADGTIRTRATHSRRDPERFTYLSHELDHLNLNPIMLALDPNSQPLSGYLHGKATAIFSGDWQCLAGTADLHLRESELMRNPVIARLYDTLRIRFDTEQPTGVGRVKLQVEGQRLVVPSFYYFNRGLEVRGAGSMDNLALGRNSPITGYAMGSTRPLKDFPLPGAEELDRLMKSLQTGAVSVQIAGQLRQPDVSVIPFPEISSPLRRLLWLQLRE